MLTAQLIPVNTLKGVLASTSTLSGELRSTSTLAGKLAHMSTLTGSLNASRNVLNGSLRGTATLTGKLTKPKIDADIYYGDTDITPSDTVRTLLTGGKMLLSDITIEPIPSNYGKITWNGLVLTVS